MLRRSRRTGADGEVCHDKGSQGRSDPSRGRGCRARCRRTGARADRQGAVGGCSLQGRSRGRSSEPSLEHGLPSRRRHPRHGTGRPAAPSLGRNLPAGERPAGDPRRGPGRVARPGPAPRVRAKRLAVLLVHRGSGRRAGHPGGARAAFGHPPDGRAGPVHDAARQRGRAALRIPDRIRAGRHAAHQSRREKRKEQGTGSPRPGRLGASAHGRRPHSCRQPLCRSQRRPARDLDMGAQEPAGAHRAAGDGVDLGGRARPAGWRRAEPAPAGHATTAGP